MPEKQVRKPIMSSVEFVQDALRNHVAPRSIGSVKERLRHAQWRLGWSHNRVRDCWYAREWVSINADETRKIEETTGLRYARQELRTIDELISKADSLMDGPEADFFRPFCDALRAMARFVDRA